jgi:DNA-binding MarR family transcriptional regulator
VQNIHISEVLRRLHEALIDVVGIFNRPQNDVILLREAGVSLDRALFPLLVLTQRRGPRGVGELADRVGRDYTTVSRQVAKLESLGLIARRVGKTDRRVTEGRHRQGLGHVGNAGRGSRAAGGERARGLERG